MNKSFQLLLMLILIITISSSHQVSAANVLYSQDGIVLQETCTKKPYGGLAVSPDGKLLVADWYTEENFHDDKDRFTIWDIQTGKSVDSIEMLAGHFGLEFSSDSRLLALADTEKAIVWDIAQRKIILTVSWE